jgi:hypothetical protein
MSNTPMEVVGPPTSAGFNVAPAPVAPPEVPAPALSPDFASDEAAELWIANQRPALPPSPGGKTGYTVADVRAALLKED